MEMVTKVFNATRFAVLVAIVGIAVLAGAIVVDSHPIGAGAHTGSQINGCINMQTGALRIVQVPSQCVGSEYPISWGHSSAAPEVDIVRVEDYVSVETEDETDSAFVYVACPDGHTVVGGGAGRSFSVGSDRWYMESSSPRLPGDPGSIGDFAGWTASFSTVDGEDAVGQYGFFAEALCIAVGQ